MSWISMVTLTAELPDEAGLRGAASRLRDVADQLSGQASVTRSVISGTGPAVWTDNSSDRVHGLLTELAEELSTGYAALNQSADALDSLASYVTRQRTRYEDAGRELQDMIRDPASDLSLGKLGEAERLVSERESIEWGVRAAMGQAGDVITAAAALASRYHGGSQSFWSRAEQYLGWGAQELGDVGIGIVDGSAQIVKGFIGLAVTAAKLDPMRAIYDPVGYYRDADHAAHTVEADIKAIISDPKQFAENLIDLQELKKDPARWLGEMIPGIVLLFASGAAADSDSGAVDDAARRAAAAERLGAPATGGAFAAELKGMDEGQRLTYLQGVVDRTSSQVPTITERTVNGQIVRFPANADFGFTAKQLNHDTIGEPTVDRAGNQVYYPRSGAPKYGGGHHFPGFGGEDDFPDSVTENYTGDYVIKPAMPANWNVQTYVENTYRLLDDSSLDWQYNYGDTSGRSGYLVLGYVDGVEMKVAVNPRASGIITSYPYDPNFHP